MTFSSLKLLNCCELQQNICKYICMTLSNFQGLAIPMVGGLGLLGNIAAIVVLRSVFSLINFHAFALYELHFIFRVTTTNNIRKEAKYNKGFNTLCTHHFLYFCQCFLISKNFINFSSSTFQTFINFSIPNFPNFSFIFLLKIFRFFSSVFRSVFYILALQLKCKVCTLFKSYILQISCFPQDHCSSVPKKAEKLIEVFQHEAK